MASIIPQDPRQRNALGAIIGAAAVAALFWNFWLVPERERLTEQQERLEALDLQNQQAQVTAVRGGANLEENLATFERHVRRLEELVPAAEEVPELIVDVNTVARELRVEPVSLTPGPAEPGVSYTRRTYDTEWVGEYHQIGAFLARIASLPRIITPIRLSVEPYLGQTNFEGMRTPVLATFTLETFALPDPAVLAARMNVEGGPGGGR